MEDESLKILKTSLHDELLDRLVSKFLECWMMLINENSCFGILTSQKGSQTDDNKL